MIRTHSALLPETYEKSDDVRFPWTCPVGSCRAMFESIVNLVNHFVVSIRRFSLTSGIEDADICNLKAHRATNLNDNLGGTTTK